MFIILSVRSKRTLSSSRRQGSSVLMCGRPRLGALTVRTLAYLIWFGAYYRGEEIQAVHHAYDLAPSVTTTLETPSWTILWATTTSLSPSSTWETSVLITSLTGFSADPAK